MIQEGPAQTAKEALDGLRHRCHKSPFFRTKLLVDKQGCAKIHARDAGLLMKVKVEPSNLVGFLVIFLR